MYAFYLIDLLAIKRITLVDNIIDLLAITRITLVDNIVDTY